MLPVVMLETRVPAVHYPRQRLQYRRLARTIHARENVRAKMRFAFAIGEVDIEPLEGSNSFGNEPHQRHSSIIYP
jgi:hypothetical protein